WMIGAKGLWPERTPMKNTIIAFAAAGVLAAALPFPAQAYCNGCGVAAGVVGGLAAGAIIGGAIPSTRPPGSFQPAPVYPLSHPHRPSMSSRLTSQAAFATSRGDRFGLRATAIGRVASKSASNERA